MAKIKKRTGALTSVQAHKLDAILNFSRTLVSLERETRLEAVLDQFKTIIDYRCAFFVTVDDDGLTIAAYRGPKSPRFMQGRQLVLADDQMVRELITSREPCLIADVWVNHPLARNLLKLMRQATGTSAEAAAQGRHAADQGLAEVRAWLSVPLVTEKNVIGLIGMLHSQPGFYTTSHAQIAMAFAYQVAVAVENDRLYRQAQSLATLQERDRLARELHDNLAQTLGYIKLQLIAAENRLSDGQVEAVQNNLRELRHIVDDTYTDVREEIFNLRSSQSRNAGFFETLRDYVARYKQHYNLNVHLNYKGIEPSEFEFTEGVRIQVIRIIQEALINVRKHAQVNDVTLFLDHCDNMARIRVVDAGPGFDVERVRETGHSGLGLRIMQERAVSIGGRLEIKSTRGHGSEIVLWIPRAIER